MSVENDVIKCRTSEVPFLSDNNDVYPGKTFQRAEFAHTRVLSAESCADTDIRRRVTYIDSKSFALLQEMCCHIYFRQQ